MFESGVRSGFTSIMYAPAARAISGIDAAGYTTAEVPTTKHRSHDSARIAACSKAPAGNISPNRTTSGRIELPHSKQEGTPSSNCDSRKSDRELHVRQRARQPLP